MFRGRGIFEFHVPLDPTRRVELGSFPDVAYKEPRQDVHGAVLYIFMYAYGTLGGKYPNTKYLLTVAIPDIETLIPCI